MGLRGHDRASRPALGHLVDHAFAGVGVLHVGQHHQVHKFLDKGGFAGAHRADQADINIPVGALRDI